MPSTYLKLTNDVLKHLGEVELDANNFADARSIFSTVKSAVNLSISHINTDEFEWPFNAYEHSHLLIPGKEEYVWPNKHKSTDWESFRIDRDDSLSVRTTELRKINRDEWYSRYRDLDDDQGGDGRQLPRYVFEAHGTGFGITPSPDKEYRIRYRYFREPDELVNHDDQTTIPSTWDHVIFLGALWYGNFFKENPDGVDRAEKKFDRALSNMRKILVNKTDDMRASVINHGGGAYMSGARTSPVTW